MAPPIGSVHHVAVETTDLPRSEAFYAGTLGLSVRCRHHTPSGLHRATWLDLADGSFLALELGAGSRRGGPPSPGLCCLALRIDRADRPGWRRHLAAAGHPVERESDFTLYVRDPDGVLIGLSHHPQASTADVGVPV